MVNDDYYCEKHELPGPMHEDSILGPHCPYCEEERRIEADRVHVMTRDPMVEPW